MLGRILAFLSGLSGAAGVATYAAAAHVVGGDDQARFALSNAAIVMMVHAAAGFALLALVQRAPFAIGWLTGGYIVVVGALLFGAAVTLPKVAAITLLPMTAPIGGSMVIGGWLLLALVGLFAGVNQQHSGNLDI